MKKTKLTKKTDDVRYATLDIPTRMGSIKMRIPQYAISDVIRGVQTMVEDEESARERGAHVPMKAPGHIKYITIAYDSRLLER